VLRIDEMPKVESPEAPIGVGEAGVAPVGPAVANTVLAVTGKRLRVLRFAVEHDNRERAERRAHAS
jgi:isoquinoline 1-oxidoreductase subunit beta